MSIMPLSYVFSDFTSLQSIDEMGSLFANMVSDVTAEDSYNSNILTQSV